MRTFPRLPAAILFCCSLALAGKASKIELGRRLFMDPTVSRGARFSCASCHAPEHGFSDPRVLSVDENGNTTRHSQPLLDLKDGSGMHWDGEFFRVRELLVARLGTTNEARDQARELAKRHFRETRGEGERSSFEERLRATAPPYYEGADASVRWAGPLARRLDEDGRYDALFRRAFGSSHVTTERLVDAMEAYVLSLSCGESAYDRDELTPAARRGLELFRGKANCTSCHKGDRFTDDRFHNTGVAFVQGNARDTGRASRSFLASDRGEFKTPSLRDVARRAPYMHDGSFPSLRDVVVYYDRGGTKNDNLDPHLRPLGLEKGEIDDLVAFLESLTSDRRPGLGSAVRHRANTRVRIEDLWGAPMAGIRVNVTPFGDRLGDDAVPADRPAAVCVTDKDGWISFPFPDWTHVILEARGLSIGEGKPLPDCIRETKVLAAPAGKTVMRVTALKTPPEKLVANGVRVGNVTFRRIRKLSGTEALYIAARNVERSAVVTFRNMGPDLGISRRYAMEFGQGFTQAIDLRPDPDSRAFFGTIGVVPAQATEHGARQTIGSERAAARRER